MAPKAKAKEAPKAAAKSKPGGDGGYPSAKASGSNSKKGAEPKAPAPSAAAAKKASKQEKQAAEAARRSAVDDMMNPPSGSESDESDDPRASVAAQGGRAPASTKEQKAQEQEALARQREEMRRQREERLAEREREKAEKAEKGGGAVGKKSDIAAVLEKVEKVGAAKLSNKERRLYAKHLEQLEEAVKEREHEEIMGSLGDQDKRLIKELEPFSCSFGAQDEQTGAVDLRIDDFSITAGGNMLFQNAKLTLAKGRRYGLLGANGGGKTTLLKHLAAKRLPVPQHWSVALVEQEAEASERAVVDEVLASDTARRRLLAEEERLFKELEAEGADADAAHVEALCQRLTAVGEELEASGAEGAEARVRVILVGLGFTASMADGPVNRLSGGWRMRVSLAKALFLQPDLLLLDEPTNHLDLDAVLWLDDYLSSYPKTLLTVTHDADFLDSVCTDCIHLEESKLRQYRGGYTEFKRAHAQYVREREKEFIKQQEMKAKDKKKLHPDEVVTKVKDYVVKFNFLAPDIDEKDMGGISVHDVEFSYSGKKPWLLADLNFRVDHASRIAIVGVNGAGKSTLMSLVSKELEPSNGEIQHSRKLKVCRYSQHFDEISPYLHMSAVEFLTSPELRRFGAGTEHPELAHKCLGQFGLPSHAHRRPMKELSGGQKSRTCFASITCRRPEILLLDEPTNHLDIESVEALIDALKRYKGGLMLISHDARLIQAAGCDLWVCKGPGEPLGKAASFDAYRKQVLADLTKRQAAAQAEAAKKTAARKRKRDEALKQRLKPKA
eukprot:TRINITY_DN21688_c0_g1_i1.p1 TRINITY_DN21688_c0_g1~~TRINITY_DN21688_c0_g1_i1.p1  ORF type:complete len:784 (-),score=169.32 TRINITY_DN21688_c0_g1_i1:140-2491(-)